MTKRTLVSFDWAMKKLLRQKANYVILEGFLSELLKKDIKVKQILESQSNKTEDDDKYNHFELLCENTKKEIILIELQFYSELDYFQRILYGFSKVITEHIKEGEPYECVKKVYSINILYFDLGHFTDYVYHGQTIFKGIHDNNILELSKNQIEKFNKPTPQDIFPEIYLLKVNNFDDVAKDTLDEWIYFLKNSELPDNFKAKGLKEVENKLKYEQMDTTAKQQYDAHIKHLMVSKSMIESAKFEGRHEGRQEGIKKGIEKGMIKSKTITVVAMHEDGFTPKQIAKYVELTEVEVLKIIKENNLL
jgi:predicted transposase/invertase (TIGR01784 family)